jgi:hypothetical protein
MDPVARPIDSKALLDAVRSLILAAREQVFQAVNVGLVALHWQVGNVIHREVLGMKRAKYAAETLSALSRHLEPEFGRGFSEKSLRHMVRFAEAFPDWGIVSTLSRQLTWSHFLALIYLRDPLRRDFYAELCRVERWSVRMLRARIDSMLFERTALSKKPAKLIAQELKTLREEDRLTPDLVFRDPYLLDFLGLKDAFSERDLEASSNPLMPGKSSSTCAGSTATSARGTRASHWRSFSAPARSERPWSTWTLAAVGSTLRSI